MLEVQKTEPNDVLEMKVIEKLSAQDIEHLTPVIEKYLTENTNPRLLVIVEQFKGWESASAFWKDFQFDSKYVGQFSRIALTGDAKWEEWIARLGQSMIDGELKYFNLRNLDDARKWLGETAEK